MQFQIEIRNFNDGDIFFVFWVSCIPNRNQHLRLSVRMNFEVEIRLLKDGDIFIVFWGQLHAKS